MTIIEKELESANLEISGFLNIRNTYYSEVSKLNQLRSATSDEKIASVLTAEIKERDDKFAIFLKKGVEMLNFRDRLNGVYQKIIKPYGFNWQKLNPRLWSPPKFASPSSLDCWYSEVGEPFLVKRVNLFSNILPLPFDNDSRYIWGGYIQPIYITDGGGLQSTNDVLKYGDVEITVSVKLAGQAFNVSVMGVNKPNVATSDGLYITSIVGESIDGFQNDSGDPGDEGNTYIEMYFVAVYDSSNYGYFFPQNVFSFDGVTATQVYSWLPNATLIF